MRTPMFLDRFREVVERQPDAIAVEGPDLTVTYRQLAARADDLGGRLRRLGAGPETVVAIALPRSPEYIAAILGVWAAGAAFAPLNPDDPPERLDFLIRDSGASLVLIAREVRGLSPTLTPSHAHTRTPPERLAYLIYTSGSTGQPKGVLVTHTGLVNVLDAQIPAFGLGPGKRALLYLATTFDASLSDIGTALLSGATLCIDPRAARATPSDLLQLLGRLGITHLDLPPSLLRLLDPSAAPDCLETLIIGGEPCPPGVVRHWASRCRVVNVYGPTEATICASLCLCDPVTWRRPLIGRPVPNTYFHVFDDQRQPVPVRVPGELYIGGIGLARGYRNRPELDAEKFLDCHGERLYRTGDLVRSHPDGEIEFLGRVDRQVKVRGMLVAPEEIEAELLHYPQIERAAVIKRALSPTREGLAAYVVATHLPPTAAALRRHLLRRLPPWMLPQRFEFLDRMPLTASGKPDLSELVGRPLTRRATPTSPTTPQEIALARIWEQVLGVERVGVTDDFFEMGGDSLAVLEVCAAAEAAGLAVSHESWTSPTIAGLLRGAERGPLMAAFLRGDVAFDQEWRSRLTAAAARTGSPPQPELPRTILLTGASGFLGSHLLEELLRRTQARVICLARGAMDDQHVVCLRGDLAQECFGLDPAVWRELADTVDTVYHCAARVNMLLSYAALRPDSVGGTLEVLRLLCEGRRKRLHYASTLSVFVSSDRNTGRMSEDDELEDTELVYGGYAQSKWAAEYLLRATKGAAGPIAVYRLGLLTGDSRTGRSAPADFLAMFFRGLAALGCVPEGVCSDLRVDVTPVDYAAAAMAHLSLHSAAEQGLCTFHVANPRPASISDLVAALRAEGVVIEEVPIEEWERRAGECPGEEASAAYLALCRCLAGEGAFDRHRTVDLFQATGAEFGMERTVAGLRGSGLVCPETTPSLLSAYAREALRSR